MNVYGVEKFRTDTTKEGSSGIILAVYRDEKDCKEHCCKLNELQERDEYSVTRYRPMLFELK